MVKRISPLLAVLILVGCPGERPEDDPDAPEDADAAIEAVVDPATAGTIQGTITYEGTPPPPEPLDMADEPDCAEAYGEEGPFRERSIVHDGRLKNVFVHLSEGVQLDFPAPREGPVLDQIDCRYTPHVLGVQAGQAFVIRNSDPLLHNVNTQPRINRGFNISQPRQGMETSRTFAQAEVMIPVRCDVHGWMEAYIGVIPHPYYAVTDEDGSFELRNVPEGEYTVETWHERYGTQTQTVTVVAGETSEIGFAYSSDMAGNPVPLGDPLIVSWHGPDGPSAVRASEAGGEGR
jgi:hypothetical protein